MTKETGRATANLAELLAQISANRPDPHDQESNEIRGAAEQGMFVIDRETQFRAASEWIIDVENRIRAAARSVVEDEEGDERVLDPQAAYLALNFLRNNCDILPGEPQIFGDHDGSLIAEFHHGAVRMTSIVGAAGTTLFGYRTDGDDAPSQTEIPQGSNSMRDQVRSFTKLLGVIANGKALAASS